MDAAVAFTSILFDGADGPPSGTAEVPDYAADLHLDDNVRAVTAGNEEHELVRAFCQPLRDAGAITYRHDVFRDLEDAVLLEAIRSFGREMEVVQRRLAHASKARHPVDQERWLVGSAEVFGSAVSELNGALRQANPSSAALSGFREYLISYVESAALTTLEADTRRVKAALNGVNYRLRIHGLKVTITRFRPEPDYSVEVLETFDKFRQDGERKRYDWRFDQGSDMNHVEAAILDRVARLHPDVFLALHDYAQRHRAFLDPTIARFDGEVRFYLAWLDFIERVQRGTDLRFCYPEVDRGSHAVEACQIFDLALAASLIGSGRPVVANDVVLDGGERIVLVTGPNQGGKTTLARAVGQLHHLARIGVPVPGERVQLPLVDRIFTHFERQERVEDLSSKLEDDLRRIHAILEQATPESLLILNESFTSTTVDDQLFIGRQVMRQIVERGPLCVVVSFLDELATLDPAIVSMVGTVDPDDHTRRTFEIVRRPPDGLAYALAIAEKHRVTYPSLKARLGR
jgi:DNA mismatch repair protein MutS